LEIKPEDLDTIFESKLRPNSSAFDPAEIPGKLKEFMKQVSDFQGVESSKYESISVYFKDLFVTVHWTQFSFPY